jgi:lysophospholipase L1-like esterase
VDASPSASAIFGKTARTLGVLGLALAIPYVVPSLARFRVIGRAADDEAPAGAATTNAASPSVGENALPATKNLGSITNALPERAALPTAEELARLEGSIGIEDPGGKSLEPFFSSLVRTDHKEPGAVTRILHYGDSIITADFVSGALRRMFQVRFGDAGHGFILTANPWEWYFHNDVTHWASDGWSMSRITGPLSRDGMYGLGGVSFRTAGVASAGFGTADKGDYGRSVSRFDIYYLEQPYGGDVDVRVAGQYSAFSTRGPAKVSRVHSVEVPDGAAQLVIKTRASGEVRLFGVALERDVPGVVYDALGANGARSQLWQTMSESHWGDQMALRKPSLVILQYGTNESEDPNLDLASYRAHLASLIEKVKSSAGKDAAVLVMSPLDRAERIGRLEFRTRKIIPLIVDCQRVVARQRGVAFWNAYEAMGGAGSIARWVRAEPQLASWDLTHPTPAGAEHIATLFYKAVMAGFQAYVARHPDPPAAASAN